MIHGSASFFFFLTFLCWGREKSTNECSGEGLLTFNWVNSLKKHCKLPGEECLDCGRFLNFRKGSLKAACNLWAWREKSEWGIRCHKASFPKSLCQDGSLFSNSTFWGPNPGHKERSSSSALAIFSKVYLKKSMFVAVRVHYTYNHVKSKQASRWCDTRRQSAEEQAHVQVRRREH